MKIAIIGASGFVGLRLLERLHLGGKAEVVPIVHAPRSLAVVARFDLPWKVCDPADEQQLEAALRGCDYVIHSALGDSKKIVAMARALYPAAERAGIKRIVALSSAAVHTLVPAPGTDETSPVVVKQKSDYNRAKAEAELILNSARRSGKTELVQLRPSIIYGARSRLVADIAQQITAGSAYLVDEGAGICNAIHVDNLIDVIMTAFTQPGVDGETFLVTDAETVTWLDFYSAIAKAVQADPASIHRIATPSFQSSPSDRLARIAATDSVMAALPMVPARVKRIAKAAAAAWHDRLPANAWQLADLARPHPYEEICLLQSCRWRFPIGKAERLLGYVPKVSFQEGMLRTARWLEFVGLAPRPGAVASSR
ncbi:MAG: NAD-dependent epimerase/dehydratase family protein [Verrucomicrobiota bacterium]